jgi:two-component system response regulator MtrA
MKGVRILIVEDDPATMEVIALRLQHEGYETESFDRGREALEALSKREFDLIILDIMLPDIDGVSVCREIRRKSNIPVIMVTGRGDKLDRVVGLEVGADDYVVKPFMSDELLARVRAHLRRVTDYATQGPGERILNAGPLELDIHAHRVTKGDQKIDLTPTEFRLLLALVEAEGAVVAVPQLFQQVWGRDSGNQSLIETHIYNLRRKIEDNPSSPTLILTIRDAGYRFNKGNA